MATTVGQAYLQQHKSKKRMQSKNPSGKEPRNVKGDFEYEKDAKKKSTADPKSNAKDTIGAGDAFFATFTVGIIKNLELEYIVAKSCEITSYITERKGALIDLPENLKYFE